MLVFHLNCMSQCLFQFDLLLFINNRLDSSSNRISQRQTSNDRALFRKKSDLSANFLNFFSTLIFYDLLLLKRNYFNSPNKKNTPNFQMIR